MFGFPHKNKKELSDRDLQMQFHSTGNLDILGELYSRHMPLIYGVCLKYLKNREDSKDAVMQIFEKLIKDLPDYEILNFNSWLYVLSKNYCLMQLRSRQAKDKKMKIFQNESKNFMEFEEFLHPLDETEAENNKALNDCIQKLKNEQKICIELFYFNNKSYREIMELQGFDENKVKSLIQNAKRNLKICLEK